MKTGKKVWSLLLALVMLLGMLSPTVSAETAEGEVTIERIEAAPVTFIEGVYSYTENNGAGEQIGVYDPVSKEPDVTVYHSDGTTAPLSWYDAQQTFGGYTLVTDTKTTNGWTVGEYVFDITLGEYPVSIPVFVIPDPIERIEIEPVSFYEGRYNNQAGQPDGSKVDVYDPISELPDFTVYYTDGTSVQHAWNDGWTLFGNMVPIDNLADTNGWTVGEYSYRVEMGHYEVAIPVTVMEDPVESVEVLPLELKFSQHMDSYFPEGPGIQFRFQSRVQIKITMKDGTVYTTDYNEMSAAGYMLSFSDPQSYNNQWQAGQTYTVDGQILGRHVQLPVTIIDDGVKSFTVESVKPLYAGISNKFVHLDASDPIITVEYNDGTKETRSYAEYWWYNGFHLAPKEFTEEELPVGEHTLVLSYGELSQEIVVTVLENPIESFTVMPKYPFGKGVHGKTSEYFGPNGEAVPYFRYDYHTMPFTVEVKMKDGTTKTYTSDNLDDLGVQFYVEQDVRIKLAQGPEDMQEAGSYTIDATLLGCTAPQTVQVAGSGIAGVTAVYTGKVYEHMTGRWTQWDGEDIYIYQPDIRKVVFTVTFADGTQQVLKNTDTFMGSLVEDLAIDVDSQYDAPWDVGINEWTVDFLEFFIPVEVEVLPVEVMDVAGKATKPLYQGWNINDQGGIMETDAALAEPEFTVTYSDGTEKTFTYKQLQAEFPGVHLYNANVTTPGNGNVTLQFGDDQYTFPTEVKRNPVKSVTAVPSKTLIEGHKGGRYLERDTVPVYTVTYTDDTTAKFYGDDQIYEKFGFYPRWSRTVNENGYTVGQNTAEVEVFGHTVEYTFEIVQLDNPVTAIKAKAVGPIYEAGDFFGEYRYAGLVQITLVYADGMTKTVMANTLRDSVGEQLVRFQDDQVFTKWGVGTHKAVASYNGLEAEFTIEVVANPYKKLTISTENGLTVVLEREDGTKETMTATGYQAEAFGEFATSGILATDKGNLSVSFAFAEGNPENIVYMDYQGLQSNALSGCKWLNQKMAVETGGDVPEVSIDKSAEELGELVDAEAIRVWLTVSELPELEMAAEDVSLIQDAIEQMENHKEAVVLDLNLFKSDDEGTKKISEVSGKIEITVGVPRALLEAGVPLDGFKIVRVHNGEVTVLDAVYNKQDNTVTFLTDRFSAYSMSYSAHNLTKVEREATCTEDGCTAHYTCSHCSKLFVDAAGTTETTADAVRIKAEHKIGKVEAKAATCTENGNKEHYKCSACGELFADAEGKTGTTAEAVTVKAGHKLEKVAAKEATTKETGVKEHYKCSVCGKLFADAEGKTETTEAEVTIPKRKPDTGSNAQTADPMPLGLVVLLMTISALLLTGEMMFGRKRNR